MSFTSFPFAFFFAGLLFLRLFARTASRDKWLLLAASIVFYLTWNVPCILLVLFTSLMDWNIGWRLGGTTDPAARKRLLLTSLVANLGLLGLFKYTNFILQNLAALANAIGGHFAAVHYDIILPPGISYFTFASISYVLDVYYERLEPCPRARDYTLFISFFPKILSGPIARATDFLPQLRDRRKVRVEEIESGLTQMLIGAVKKMVIADQVAGNVNQIFAHPGRFDRFTLVEGALGYTVQMYCDFSGYSDMAIGAARLLGLRLPENFQMPFSSVSISEFWRRWHITMSAWFRDYLFLPLEMATRSCPLPLLRISLNMTATMFLCGLWHGPSWNYVVWGGIHGVALSVHRVWTFGKPSYAWMEHRAAQFLGTLMSRGLTLGFVVLTLVIFRTTSLTDAMIYLSRMFSAGHEGERLVSVYIYPAVAAVFLTHLLIQKDRHLALEWPAKPVVWRVAVGAALLLLLVSLAATDSPAFLYFKY